MSAMNVDKALPLGRPLDGILILGSLCLFGAQRLAPGGLATSRLTLLVRPLLLLLPLLAVRVHSSDGQPN